MAFTFLRLNAVTRGDRHETITRAERAIQECGFVTDFHMFSNQSISLNFELAVGKVGTLYGLLQDTGLKFSEESRRLLENFQRGMEQLNAEARASEVTGTLQITFFHEEPDLRIEVPPIPG